MHEKPVEACGRSRTARSWPPAAPWARGEADAVGRGEHRRHPRRRALSTSGGSRRSTARRSRSSSRRATARRSSWTPARTRTRVPSTCSSSPRWARSSPTSCSRSRIRRSGCSRSARSLRRETSSRSRRTRSSPRPTSTSAATSRAAHLLSHAGDVVVCDGFTGNICLKLLEGTIKAVLEGHPRRDPLLDARQGRRPAHQARGAPSPRAPRPGHLRRRLSPRPARPGRDRPRQLFRTAIGNAIRLAARGVEHRVVDRLGERLGRTVLASARPETTSSPSEVKWPLRAKKSTSV